MIRLRALEPEDLDALYLIENDAAEWGSTSNNVPFSRYALRDYIANQSYDIYADRQLRQVITDESNRVLGLVDLVNFDPQHHRAEVSIVVVKEHRCSGIATEALRLVCNYATDVIGLTQLYAIVPECNAASVALFWKAGYIHAATLPSWFCFSKSYVDALIFQLFLKKE